MYVGASGIVSDTNGLNTRSKQFGDDETDPDKVGR